MEEIKLTNTPDVRLYKVPKKEWKRVTKLYNQRKWPQLGQIWNKYKVSPVSVCNGCPSGIALFIKHFKLIKDKYENEIKPTEETARSLNKEKTNKKGGKTAPVESKKETD